MRIQFVYIKIFYFIIKLVIFLSNINKLNNEQIK